MKSLTKLFREQLNTYSVCLESGGDASSIFNPLISQSEHACGLIRYYDPNLQDKDIFIIGIGQGALIARFLIETCEGIEGRIKRFISIGGPHMGVAKVPFCENGIICSVINSFALSMIYNSFIQDYFSPASYYKNNHNISNYLQYCSFLPSINNEVDLNPAYRENFKTLEKLVLIKFSNDTVLIPKETAWFEFYDKDDNIVALKDSDFYNNDLIGLKYLVDQNRVDFLEFEGDHLQFTEQDIINRIIPYFK